MTKKTVIIAMTLLCINAGHAMAEEVDPGAVLNRSPENLEYYRLKKALQENTTEQDKETVLDNTQKTSNLTSEAGEVIINVTKLTTDPSEILSADEITAIIAKYEGKQLSIKDLNEAIKEFNELYVAKGYISARAILPPQKIVDGIVAIKLVEGRVGDIYVEDNKHTSNRFILNSISLQRGDLIKLDTLEKDAFYFNRTNDVQLRLELKPGKDFGTTDCVIKAFEPENDQLTLFSDNAGRNETGLYRFGMTYVNNSLFGHRDSLTLTPIWADGTLAGSVAYNIPIDTEGTRFGVSYSKNQTNIVAGPFQSLDITGDSSDIGFTLSHPYKVKQNYKLDGFAEWHLKTADTFFSGTELLENDVKTAVVGFTVQSLEDKGFWYTRHDFTRGIVEDGNNFFRYNFSMVRQRLLPHDRTLLIRVASQMTNNHLLPTSDQFFIGGMSTVRGYREGILAGDKGYVLSTELGFPISQKVQGFAFIDHGGAFAFVGNDDMDRHSDYLTSIGLGASINFSKRIAGKFAIGIPLRSIDDASHIRIHYFLQSILF